MHVQHRIDCGVRLTIVFPVAVASLVGLASWNGQPPSVAALAALLVTLIPTTIGGLLSAIGIAGMDRLVRFNVLATSGRAMEARVNVLRLNLALDRLSGAS